LHRLSNRLRVAEVVLLPLRIGTNVLRRHQPGIVTKALELATEMMCPDASLHPDQAGRHMDHFAGLDVSVKNTSICIVDDTGRILREVKVASEPDALVAVLTNRSYPSNALGWRLDPCRNGCSARWRKQTWR
jgi:hypothetical protein